MRKRVKKATCPNCGYQFAGADNYCPSCGQENHTHQLPLKHFVLEFFESLFHFDTKFFHTIKELFLKPGTVTKNYNANKRAGYVPPFRFYLFTSAIYFLAIALLEPLDIKVVDAAKNEHQEGLFKLNASGFSDTEKEELRQLSQKENLTGDDIRAFIEKNGKEATWYNFIGTRMIIQVLKSGDREALGHKILKNISYMMFLLMPLFALLLYLLYWKKKTFYAAQLVFSVHFHTLAFILLLATLLLAQVFPASISAA